MKRPFCNAFTGCGRYNKRQGVDGISAADIETARKIVREAALWESLLERLRNQQGFEIPDASDEVSRNVSTREKV